MRVGKQKLGRLLLEENAEEGIQRTFSCLLSVRGEYIFFFYETIYFI